MKQIVEDVIAAYGGVSGVQRRFNYREPMAVYNWRARGIPGYLVADIHMDTGLDIAKLREAASSKKTHPRRPHD